MKAVIPVSLVLAALVAAITPAAAAGPPDDDRHLWATVNACDTQARPDMIGIRASMPGSGRRETLLMRFRVQYMDPADGRWRFIATGADSGLRRIGVSRAQRLESGYDFRFEPMADGPGHLLRGHVTFVWRRGARITRQLSEITEAGHRSSRGADPPGYSAATCRIS